MRATEDEPSDGGVLGTSERIEAAPAKINLALHVTGKRPDGYHLLDSLVVFAGTGDLVRVEPGEDEIELWLAGPFAEELSATTTIDSNLAVRAARALAETRKGNRPPTRLIMEKRLPIASGIGGGSADAAAALRLLDRFWQLKTPADKLGKIAQSLGADVPMCLASQPLRAKGIGEAITPLPGIPPVALLLVNPGVSVSTPAVFGRLQRTDDPPLPRIPDKFRSIFELVIWLRGTRNSLEEPAKIEAKAVSRALQLLGADPECIIARMSGSGSTCFGIFANLGAAQRAAVRLRIARPNWWIEPTMTGGSEI